LILLMPFGMGCQSPWSSAAKKNQAFNAPTALTPPAMSLPKNGLSPPKNVVAQPAQPIDPSAPTTEEEALASVLDELSEVGAIDPDAKQLLMADLRQAKPENWALIVKQFRSALAYRQQLAEREQKATSSASLAVSKPAKIDELLVAKPTARAVIRDSEITQSSRAQPAADLVSLGVRHASPNGSRPQRAVVARSDQPIEPMTSQHLPNPPDSRQPMARQASYVGSPATTATQTLDWQGHLQAAVAGLEMSVQPAPGSTDEVNEHMRLRLLRLMAGDADAALSPIPGATAPQQDYWNKQLFAVSTFLDSDQQPDDKRRAAGSLMHLDQARAKLAELATMQVRRLSFVDSVAGYGSYEVHDEASFRPGTQVTLYAEVENFTSESTRDGYRTRLGTSYEVVDRNGKRVDSAQFPEVEDLCRNPRRDFHMQYTVTLPTRIYPDQYELRLVITDQQSQKIGQASLPFEIVE